jgi:hypothetical protein
MQPTELKFKVLIYREYDDSARIYIGQCLNYDLVAQGESVLAVLNSLERVIKTQIALSVESGIEPFSDFERAPDKLWARYENSGCEENAFTFSFESKPAKRPFSASASMKLAAA